MEQIELVIGILGLYALVIHNAIMVHLLAQQHDNVSPILPDGGQT